MNVGAFEVRGAGKQFGAHVVLHSLTFTIARGQHTAIWGGSGVGKTTLLRLMAGLDVPTSGTVMLDGRVVSRDRTILVEPRERGVAMVFQDLALWPNLSVIDNVLLGLVAHRLSRADRHARAEEALTLCAVLGLKDRMPASLSGGELQRVALARALAIRPTYLFLDEPFTGLDLVIKARLLDDIRHLASAHAVTLVMVTHDPFDALTLCDRVLLLCDGVIEHDGTWPELFQRSDVDLVRSLGDRIRSTVPLLSCAALAVRA